MKLTATVGAYVIAAITISVTTAQRPNIIFIVADDLGWNDVSWHNPEVIMPHLDKMARSGVILNSSYVQPMCSPSRNSFMSGYYPYHTGLQHFVILAAQPTGLPLDVTLLPQRLKELGYNTHIIGKWHLGFCKWEYTPTFRGFDSYLGYYTSQENYVTHTRNYHHFKGVDFHLNTEPELSENGTFSPYIFVRRTEQILQSHNKSNPLFLYLPLQSVHAPLQVPKRFEDLYPNVKNVTRRKKLGMITFLDETVANVTQLLDAGGFLDNALIIFTTDNGGPVWFGANNLPLRGAKTTLWEGGTRGVALVHSRTLLKKTGYTNNGMMHAVDWFPTILEVAGGAPQPGIDGVSMWSTLSQGAPSPRTEFLYNIDDIYKNAALRQGDFKLIEGSPGNYSDWYPLPGETTPAIALPDQMTRPVENVTKYRLYNIRDDPAERIDLSTSHTDIVAKMVDRLNEYRKSSHAARYPPDDPKGDPRNFGGVWSPGWC